jgi:hypothetical protein
MVYNVYAGQNLTELLAYLQYWRTYPDSPKTLVLPGLSDPSYAPPDRGGAIIANAFTWAAVTTIFVAARLWVRYFEKNCSMGLDDWLCIPATVSEWDSG